MRGNSFTIQLGNDGEPSPHLQNKLLEALLHINPSLCTALKKKASILPREVNPLLFRDDPVSFLQKMLLA